MQKQSTKKERKKEESILGIWYCQTVFQNCKEDISLSLI